jgi:hypothetical protein
MAMLLGSSWSVQMQAEQVPDAREHKSLILTWAISTSLSLVTGPLILTGCSLKKISLSTSVTSSYVSAESRTDDRCQCIA